MTNSRKVFLLLRPPAEELSGGQKSIIGSRAGTMKPYKAKGRDRMKKLNGAAGNAAMFTLGAAAYPVVELLWRGHTHWAMSLTGGICTLAIHLLNGRMSKRSLTARCGMGCAVITLAEFAVGCVVNRLLGWNVWDYSNVPFNIMGQVCLLYSAFWFLLSIPVVALSSGMMRR